MKAIEAAALLDSAASHAKAVPQLSLSQKFTLEEAYLIQTLSIDRRIFDRGEAYLGVKLGFTSKAKMEQMGVHELIWGKLTDKMYYEPGSSIKRSEFIHPRAEPELIFKVAKDINEEVTLDNAKSFISHVALALEVIDSRYDNFKFSLEDVVADNCSSAAFTHGEWVSVDGVDLSDMMMSMVSEDVIVGSGTSKAILGNPWESVVRAARLASAAGTALRAGEVILAGAATPAVHIQPGETISAFADGLGSVYLDVV